MTRLPIGILTIALAAGTVAAPAAGTTARARPPQGRAAPPPPPLPKTQLIVDVRTAPNKFWNLPVVLKGHVVATRPDPPGSNRGWYTFRDSSEQDIEIRTTELPAVRTELWVLGVVIQPTKEARVPVLHEDARASTLEELQRKIREGRTSRE